MLRSPPIRCAVIRSVCFAQHQLPVVSVAHPWSYGCVTTTGSRRAVRSDCRRQGRAQEFARREPSVILVWSVAASTAALQVHGSQYYVMTGVDDRPKPVVTGRCHEDIDSPVVDPRRRRLMPHRPFGTVHVNRERPTSMNFVLQRCRLVRPTDHDVLVLDSIRTVTLSRSVCVGVLAVG